MFQTAQLESEMWGWTLLPLVAIWYKASANYSSHDKRQAVHSAAILKVQYDDYSDDP